MHYHSTLLRTFNKRIDKFLTHALNRLDGAKVNVVISTTKYVLYPIDNMKCNGYFYENDDGDGLTFAIAIGKPLKKWFPVFVHEFCHFMQHVEHIPYWDMLEDNDELWEWVSGKDELSIRKLNRLINNARNIEHDCELRVLEQIELYKLPIDAERYSQTSASYIIFYDYLKKHRKWYKMGKEPYRNEELLALMPKKLSPVKSKKLKLTPEMEILYKECV